MLELLNIFLDCYGLFLCVWIYFSESCIIQSFGFTSGTKIVFLRWFYQIYWGSSIEIMQNIIIIITIFVIIINK